MDITGATVDQIAKIAAVDDMGKPTAWEAVDISSFAPAPFKPVGKSYLTFSSHNSFTLVVNDAIKHWDGTLEYFSSDKENVLIEYYEENNYKCKNIETE